MFDPSEAHPGGGEAGARGYYSAGRVRRSLMHFLLGRGITAVASIIVPILLVRELSVTDYAGYTAFSGLLMAVLTLSNGGLDRVIFRYFPQLRVSDAEQELRVFCWRLVALRSVLLVACLAGLWTVYPFLASRLSLPPNEVLLPAFAIYSAMFGISTHLSRSLQALLLQREATIGLAIEWIGKLAVLVAWLMVFNRIGLVQVLWIQAVCIGLGAGFMLWRLRVHLSRRVDATSAGGVLDYLQVLRLGWHNYMRTLTAFHTSVEAQRLACAYFLPGLPTATFGFASAVTAILSRHLPAKLLLGLIEPTIMARYSEARDFERVTHLVSIVLKVNLFILIPATVWVVLSGRPLVELITGGKYGQSVWLFGGLMLVLMVNSHYQILQLITNAIEKSNLLFYSNLYSLLLVPVVLIGVKTMGLAGLVIGVLMVVLTRDVYVLRRLRGFGFAYVTDWWAIGRIALIAMVACLSAQSIGTWMFDGLSGMLVTLVVATTLYLVLTMVWKPFTQPERDTLNRFLGRRLFVW